jgi:site-specific recombinase XerD
VADRQITIDQLYEAYLDYYRANEKASLEGAEQRWGDGPGGRLKREFSGMKALALTTDRLNQYASKYRAEGVKNATINRDIAALQKAFNLGLVAKKLQTIPHFPKFKEARPRKGFLEKADYAKLAPHVTELWLRAFLAASYEFGVRRGELLGDKRNGYEDALRVRHVNLVDRTIFLGDTKNGDDRIVHMTQEVYTLIAACCVGKEPDDFVFTRDEKDGKQVLVFRDRWKKLLRDAGIEKGMVHDNRRSAVRNMVRDGIPDLVAMRISGHKTRSVFDWYNITSDGDLKEAVRKMEEAKKIFQAQNRHILDETAPKTGSDDFAENSVKPSKSVN